MFDFEVFEHSLARVIFAAFLKNIIYLKLHYFELRKYAIYFISLFQREITVKSPNTEKTARRRCRGGRSQKDTVVFLKGSLKVSYKSD